MEVATETPISRAKRARGRDKARSAQLRGTELARRGLPRVTPNLIEDEAVAALLAVPTT